MSDYDKAIKELQLGNYSEGMVILQNLLKTDPDDIDILYNLGMCYSEMGLLTKSVELLEKCVRLAPGFANALVALGFSYYQQGEDDKALKTLKKALEVEPDNYYALKNLGSLYNKKGEPDKAMANFEKADSIMPGMSEILLGLGQAYELKKDFDCATTYYEQVKNSDAADLIVDKAIEGLNRIAVEQAKPEGQESRADVVMYCLEAIELFSEATPARVKEVAFEIAMLGNDGLSINDLEKKYTLKSLEGRFSGMELLCYMFVGFKIIDQGLPPIADLEDEYQQALKLYRSRLDEH